MWGTNDLVRRIGDVERVASEARNVGTQALKEIAAHTGACAERWNEARATWARVEKSLAAIPTVERNGYRQWLIVAGAVITVLVTALATVLWHMLAAGK